MRVSQGGVASIVRDKNGLLTYFWPSASLTALKIAEEVWEIPAVAPAWLPGPPRCIHPLPASSQRRPWEACKQDEGVRKSVTEEEEKNCLCHKFRDIVDKDVAALQK